MVIVRDMWLTGFDVPCPHTMYVDKPVRGHGWMQAIAHVNRIFKDKPGMSGGGHAVWAEAPCGGGVMIGPAHPWGLVPIVRPFQGREGCM
ncbi:MAG: type I restriction enzyme subunit R domain-containing protein [Acidobacteriaceae bacterium]